MSKIYITYIGFWPGFDVQNNTVTKKIFKLINKEFIHTNNLNETDILIIGSFINSYNYNIIANFNKKKILFITEPVNPHYNHLVYKLYTDNHINVVSGCIENNHNNNMYKYPLYLCYFDYQEKVNNISIFKNVNNFVKNNELLKTKKFGCLVNTHDNGNTRTTMYNLLSSIDKIDCPSKLFNNCSNQELNKVGNIEFYKKYIYNICPENYINCYLKGYITEKLLNACLGGAIPIYTGSFDDIDAKIFNPKRILFFDPTSEESMINIQQKILSFKNNPELLYEFYSQDVFLPTAIETIDSLCINLASWFANI